MAPRVDNCIRITHACCILHNLLRREYPTLNIQDVDREAPETHDLIEGSWRSGEVLASLRRARASGRNVDEAKNIRHHLKQYYNTVGRVSFQDRIFEEPTHE